MRCDIPEGERGTVSVGDDNVSLHTDTTIAAFKEVCSDYGKIYRDMALGNEVVELTSHSYDLARGVAKYSNLKKLLANIVLGTPVDDQWSIKVEAWCSLLRHNPADDIERFTKALKFARTHIDPNTPCLVQSEEYVE
eukprot:465405-Amphidinium_carterae.1